MKREATFTETTFKDRFLELCGNDTQQSIADAIGVSRATIGYYMNGERRPDIETLSKIAKYFNVTSDYLLGLSQSKKAENADIVERLGLSESTISRFEKRNESRSVNKPSPQKLDKAINLIIDNLFESNAFSDYALYLEYFDHLYSEANYKKYSAVHGAIFTLNGETVDFDPMLINPFTKIEFLRNKFREKYDSAFFSLLENDQEQIQAIENQFFIRFNNDIARLSQSEEGEENADD